MEQTLVLVCCQYCSSVFKSKDELHFHWFKHCLASECRCSNCICPVRVETDHCKQYRIYFNKTNLHVGLTEIMKKHFPSVSMPQTLAEELGCPKAKKVRFNYGTPMEEN